MTDTNLKILQNGSDIRGISMEGVPGEAVTLGETEAYLLGRSFGKWLIEKGKKSSVKIAVGRDPRLTGEKLETAIISGLLSANSANPALSSPDTASPITRGSYRATVKVMNCGLSSTPAMFMSTVFPEYNCDGAIMITASHLPFNRNGFKFFSRKGGLDKKDISAIISQAESFVSDEIESGRPTDKSFDSSVENTDLLSFYSDYMADLIKKGVNHPTHYDTPLRGLKIVVDAGNGAGGFYASKVLAPLGADVTGSQFLEPNGTFPNHMPNPENKEAMESICAAVLKNKADLGLIFDTDVDRSSAVDKFGKEISRNGIVAMAAVLAAEISPGTTVVTDSITSDELTYFIEKELGCIHHRFKRGYKNVINESMRLNETGIDSRLAIETSGHAAFKENYFLDDGAYLATKIVIKAAMLKAQGKTIDTLIEKLAQPAESKEIRLKILLDENSPSNDRTPFDFSSYGDRIIADLEMFAHVGPGMRVVMPNFEGARIAFDAQNGNGWCLLRKSLHDPLMPLNIESKTPGGCKIIEDILKGFLKQYERLDLNFL